jgi:hypothetical protein
MTGGGKIRAYVAEPLLATLTLSLVINVYSLADVSAFMHAEAKDILSLLLVLLGSALALWVGLFWVSNTPFGSWLMEKGEFDGIQRTYIYSIFGIFLACLGCVLAAYVESANKYLQTLVLWLALFAFYSMPFLLNSTRLLLKLHALFSNRPRKVAPMDRQAEN